MVPWLPMRRTAAAIGTLAILGIAGIYGKDALWGQATPSQTPAERLAALETSLEPTTVQEDPGVFLLGQAGRRANVKERRRLIMEDCAEALHKANRDQQWDTTLRCFRNDLLLDISLLRDQLLEARTLENASGFVMSGEALRDALAAVVEGIDTGVYSSEAGLRETRLRLQEKYRLPLMKAELDLHWQSLRLRLWKMLQILKHDHPEKLTESILSCLEEGVKNLLNGSGNSNISSSKLLYQSTATSVHSCVGLLRDASPTASGATLP